MLLILAAWFAYSKDHPLLFPFFYGISQSLDAADGMAARKFNQSSKFGAALDMVVDRASVALIFLVLSTLYPKAPFAFIICFILDFGSHWL